MEITSILPTQSASQVPFRLSPRKPALLIQPDRAHESTQKGGTKVENAAFSIQGGGKDCDKDSIQRSLA